MPAGVTLMLAGLDVAVQHAARMGGIEAVHHLAAEGDDLGHRQRRAGNPFGQRGALDVLEHQRLDSVGFRQAVDGAEAGVAERGQHPRLAPEPRQPIGIAGEASGQHLQRDVARPRRQSRAR